MLLLVLMNVINKLMTNLVKDVLNVILVTIFLLELRVLPYQMLTVQKKLIMLWERDVRYALLITS